jgi:hypothetical protein
VKLNPKSPKKIDSQLNILIDYLELDVSKTSRLKYRNDQHFNAEVDCCHLNVWVKCNLNGGTPLFGWILAQDKSMGFSEAIFHSVWQSNSGDILDVTPRKDKEKRVLFIPDNNRKVDFTRSQGMRVIQTFDNVRMFNGRIINGLRSILIAPQTSMIECYGLNKKW